MKNLLILTSLIVISSMVKAQVYELSFFLNKMPEIPKNIVGTTNEEKEAFCNQIKSIENYLDSLERNYKHPMCSLEKSSQQEMFEFNNIWEEIYQLHDTYFNEKQSKTLEKMGDLSQEEFAKQAELSDELQKIRNESTKTMKNISGRENQINRAMYDNHSLYSQKRAELLTKDIIYYKSIIEDFASKIKRADTILLASFSSGTVYPCAAIFNVRRLLAMYEGYLELLVPPYTPKFQQ